MSSQSLLRYAAQLALVFVSPFAFAAGSVLQFQTAAQSISEDGGQITANVTRSGSGGAVTVHYQVAGVTAKGTDGDMAAVTGTLSWLDGESGPKPIVVPIIDDSKVEADEDFVINLSNATGGTFYGGVTLGTLSQHKVTILNDDAAPTGNRLQFRAAMQSVQEGAGQAIAVVQRVGTSGAVAVRYTVAGGSATVGDGDVGAANGVLSWEAGDASDRTISVPVLDDQLIEGSEQFIVRLVNPTGGAFGGGVQLGSPSEQSITILDDDVEFSFGRGGSGCPFPNGTTLIERWQGTLGNNTSGVPRSGAADHIKSFGLPASCNIASLKIRINWDAPADDLDLEVTPPTGTLPGSANTNYPGNLAETVFATRPAAGTYSVRTVGYTTRSTAFTGMATVVVGLDTAGACETAFAGVGVGASVAAVDPDIKLDVPGNLLLTFADAWSRDQAVLRLQAGTVLSATEKSGVRAFKHLYTVKVPVASITPAVIEGLRSQMDRLQLISIWGEHDKYPLLRTSVPLIGVTDAREHLATPASPLTGKGIGVAILDTGVDKTQGDLRRVVHNVRVLPTGGAVEAENTEVENGHGTHLAGTIVGDGTMSGGVYRGVAPGADVVGIKVDAGSYLFVLEGMDYTLEKQQQYNIRVSNHSYGPVTGSGFRFNPAAADAQAIKRLHDSGIIPVFAAGNLGPANDTISDDAQNPCAIGVAAGDRNFKLADFSSRGTSTGIAGPDITAPGVNITASRAINGFASTAVPKGDNPYYSSISGTSMAAPHIAGVIAIMLEANPELNFEQVLTILRNTARTMPGYAAHQVGAGYVDALGAIAAAKGVTKPIVDGPVTVGGDVTRVKHVIDTAGLYLGVVCSGCPAEGQNTAPHKYEFVLPPMLSDVRELRFRIEWVSPADHLDLEVFGPPSDARLGISSAVGVNFQEITLLPVAPSAGVATGRYRIEATEFFLARAMDFDFSVSVVRDAGATPVSVPRSAFTSNPAPACSDGADNDGDGLTDFPADPGCSSATDPDENNGGPAQCADGIDNDGDGWTDLLDAGCANASDNDETDAGTTQCSNGVDDADPEDTLADEADPDCTSGSDNDETAFTGGGTATTYYFDRYDPLLGNAGNAMAILFASPLPLKTEAPVFTDPAVVYPSIVGPEGKYNLFYNAAAWATAAGHAGGDVSVTWWMTNPVTGLGFIESVKVHLMCGDTATASTTFTGPSGVGGIPTEYSTTLTGVPACAANTGVIIQPPVSPTNADYFILYDTPEYPSRLTVSSGTVGPDSDGDGVVNSIDNCPTTANPNQSNTYGGSSSPGDACEDSDQDGVMDANDAFPLDGTETADSDKDGIGDNTDQCPLDSTPDCSGGNSDFPADGHQDVRTFYQTLVAAAESGDAVTVPTILIDTFLGFDEFGEPGSVNLVVTESDFAEGAWFEVNGRPRPDLAPWYRIFEGQVPGEPGSVARIVVAKDFARGAVRIGDTVQVIRIRMNGNLPVDLVSGAVPSHPSTTPPQSPEPSSCPEDYIPFNDIVRAVPPYLSPDGLGLLGAPALESRVILDGDYNAFRRWGWHTPVMMVGILAEMDLTYGYEVGIFHKLVGLHLNLNPLYYPPVEPNAPFVEVGRWWDAHHAGERDIVHLFTGHPSTYAQANCIGSVGTRAGYSFTSIDWEEQYVVFHENALAHEFGHLYSAHHHYGNHVESELATIMIQGYTPGAQPQFSSVSRLAIRGWAEENLGDGATVPHP